MASAAPSDASPAVIMADDPVCADDRATVVNGDPRLGQFLVALNQKIDAFQKEIKNKKVRLHVLGKRSLEQ